MCRRSCRRSRRGTVAVEALLVIPVLILVILTGVEFVLLLSAETRLHEASAKAARVRAVGGTELQMTEAVRAVLGENRYEHAKIVYNDCPANDLKPGELVVVRVELPADRAAPGLLKTLGIHLAGGTLVGQTAAPKE